MIDELTSELDPVIDELLVAAEPVTEGLEAAFAVDDGLVVPLPAAVPEAEPLTLPAWESGMQSWCTGLAECSFALPVSLSASLPACGCPSSLHSGFEADAVAESLAARFAEALLFVPDGAVEAVAPLLNDWFPVEALVLLLSDWLPVLVVVSLLIDWLPVDVVLSMLRLERPRRSTVGETVDVDPVMEEFTSALEPVTDELLLDAEPVIEGLELALAVVLAVVLSLVVLFCASAGAEPSIAATASALI